MFLRIFKDIGRVCPNGVPFQKRRMTWLDLIPQSGQFFFPYRSAPSVRITGCKIWPASVRQDHGLRNLTRLPPLQILPSDSLSLSLYVWMCWGLVEPVAGGLLPIYLRSNSHLSQQSLFKSRFLIPSISVFPLLGCSGSDRPQFADLRSTIPRFGLLSLLLSWSLTISSHVHLLLLGFAWQQFRRLRGHFNSIFSTFFGFFCLDVCLRSAANAPFFLRSALLLIVFVMA